MSGLVHKICPRKAWQDAEARGLFEGSADDRRDGYIHLSTAEQLPGTLAKHFAGRADLLLIAFDTVRLGSCLKWEASRGGALFPHLYAPLTIADALWVKPLALDAEGRHVIQKEAAA